MAEVFQIDMLPAREGDCLWIEYGDENNPHRILIDGGRQSAYETLKARFNALPQNQRAFELAVLTHVDADHIEGFLQLLEDKERGVTFKDFWFNARHHLASENFQPHGGFHDEEDFGPVQGDTLTELLIEQGWPWNIAFCGRPVVVPDEGKLPAVLLAGGMKITILSPTWKELEKMKPVWARAIKAALDRKTRPVDEAELDEDEESYGALDTAEINELAALSFRKDSSPANGTSIALLAEYREKRLLLAGDAFANVLVETLNRLDGLEHALPLDVDAFKISHHGSRKTLNNEVIRLANSCVYLLSTDGSRHGHPDREAIARILKFGPADKTLVFNYRFDNSEVWDKEDLKKAFSYGVVYPSAAHNGLMRWDLLQPEPVQP